MASLSDTFVRIAEDIEMAPMARALESDRFIYRTVVIALAVTLVGSLGCAVLLTVLDEAIPDLLVALGPGALGVLGGLLAPSPIRQQGG
jgi:hypothetical protein